jgi:hypothetical protein
MLRHLCKTDRYSSSGANGCEVERNAGDPINPVMIASSLKLSLPSNSIFAGSPNWPASACVGAAMSSANHRIRNFK